MYYPRAISARLTTLTKYFPAVVLSGARQSGKTTLLKNTFGRYNYVSLDLPSTAEQAERNPSDFLNEHPAPLVIDEVQYAPGLFRHLKTAIDENRHAMGRYILTGSQHFTLMKGVSDSLAGRSAFLELENLSYHEISSAINLSASRNDLLSLMIRGQFPELWRVRELPAREFYAAYLATYLERDVRQLLNVASLRDFERFIRILASRSATMLNKSDVARDVGVSVKAVGDWLSVLQASGQIVLLEPWFSNFGKRIVKTPKVFFRDSGLLCFLLNLDAASLASSPLVGAVWETFVLSEMRKLNSSMDDPANFWYYRDQRSREIDFVIERGGALSFMECKWQENPNKDDVRQLLVVSAELERSNSSWRAGSHYVIGTPTSTYEIAEGLTAAALRDIKKILSG